MFGVALLIALLALAPGPAASVTISELMASNASTLVDEDGDTSDWIELHNSGAEAIDLAGYGLSDDPDELAKWVLPSVRVAPGARLVVFASGKDRSGPELHAAFKLSSEGESVVLTAPDGSTADAITFGPLPADISYGRSASAPTEWRVFDVPTPAQANGDGLLGIAAPPALDTPGGRYAGPITATVSSADPASVIRYTIDGSVPTPSDPELTRPLAFTSTGVLRVRAFRPDHVASSVATASYLIDEPTALPVFALVADPERLWSRTDGLYNEFNQYKRLEAPVHLALMEGGETVLAMDGGVRLHGGFSRRYAQKSLALFARGRYGADAIEHPLFLDLPHTEYQSFVLRNSGQDWFTTMLRDGLMQTLVSETAIDRLEYRPAVVYLNGAYWGLHNLREKPNEHYIARHHGVDPDAIDMLEIVWGIPEPQVIQGDAAQYQALIDWLETNGIATDDELAYVEARVDLDNFVDYHVAQIYFNNRDWPGNNVKLWRPQTADGRWRWILFDTDTGFGYFGDQDFAFNTLAFATDPDGTTETNLPEVTALLRGLLAHQGFQHRFVNRFADLFNADFEPDRVVAHVDSLAAGIRDEVPRHHQRWPESAVDWESQLDRLRTFAEHRPAFVEQHLREAFGLGARAAVTVQVEGRGHVRVNRLAPRAFPWTGTYFENVPVPLEAVPAPGWRFAGWADGTDSPARVVGPGGAWTARFERGPRATTVVLNEVQYNAPDALDSEDWVEIANPTAAAVDVSGWVLSDDDDTHQFALPAATTLEPGGFLVLCRDAAAFATAYPQAAPCLGDWDFGLSGGGDQVRLFDAAGALVDSLEYDDAAPWPTNADGEGSTLELLDAHIDNALAESWRASVALGGTPGAPNSVAVDDADAPVELASALELAWPNPFRDAVTLRYTVAAPGPVSLRVFDALGREVARLVDRPLEAGPHEVRFAPQGLASGIYLVRLDTAQGTQTRHITLVR